MKDPATMTAGQINRELARLRARDRVLTDRFIAAGRGADRVSDILRQADALALQYQAMAGRLSALKLECDLRYGPDFRYLSELPREFGPRRRA